MNCQSSQLAAAQVDAARLWSRHIEMARHGATAAGGVNRQALSVEDIEARRTLISWGSALGLQAFGDEIGNLFLRWAGLDAGAAPVMTGSHLDSQPTGGRFDGVYGVLAGLEAVQAMQQAGLRPRRPIEIVAWMNEEGSRFAPGMMGSSAFAGASTVSEWLTVQDARGTSVGTALAELQAAFRNLPQASLLRPVHAYLEAHIEQGPVLERRGVAIGVVNGIQGKRTFAVNIEGEEAHAGTTPQLQRKDALRSAVAVIGALQTLCEDPDDLVRFTVGRLDMLPNAPSVVPSSVNFSIDLRHPNSSRLQALGDAMASTCAAQAGSCSVTVRELSCAMSIEFTAAMRELIRRQTQSLGISCIDLLSAAGHDARYLHQWCPSGMIFVPCKDGLSHNEAESATAADLADGARVLAAVLVELAS